MLRTSLSVVFGVLLIFFPGSGLLSLLWLRGVIPQDSKPQSMQPV